MGGGEVLLDAFVNILQQLNGDFNFENAYQATGTVGLIFCFIAMGLLNILLMNLLIAIMFEAYESVKTYAAARFCFLQLEQWQDYRTYPAALNFISAVRLVPGPVEFSRPPLDTRRGIIPR